MRSALAFIALAAAPGCAVIHCNGGGDAAPERVEIHITIGPRILSSCEAPPDAER